jgi:hypothetical protein
MRNDAATIAYRAASDRDVISMKKTDVSQAYGSIVLPRHITLDYSPV